MGIEKALTPSTLLVLAAISLVVIYIVLGGITLLNNYTTIKIGQKMVNDMRRDLYAHLQRLSLAFHNRRQVGDLMYRVTADTYAIQSLTMNGVFPILTALVLLGGMFFVMMKIDWQLTLLSLTVCPALLVSIIVMSRRITRPPWSHASRKARSIPLCSGRCPPYASFRHLQRKRKSTASS